MTRLKKIAVILLAVAALPIVMSCCVWSFQNRVGKSATTEEAPLRGLPSDATDVRWCLPGAFGPNTFFDFTTTESGFRQWVADHGSELRGPIYGPYSVHYYDHDQGRFDEVAIEDAIAHEWREEDRGVYMVYDRERKRAYFHSHSR